MNPSEKCPRCGSLCYKRNGRIHTGKQNHRCKDCGRQVVLSAQNRRISDADRALIKRLLNERVSLRGICRAVQVSLRWLVDFVVGCYAAAPDDLNVRLPEQPDAVIVQRLVVEADEAWSFVRKKANSQWLWLALEAQSRQVIAFHVGDRSRKSARKLWKKIPSVYRRQATFYTDGHASYQDVIPSAQHQVITKKARKTNHIERLNCTLRQRVSRLVRATLSFWPRPNSRVTSRHLRKTRPLLTCSVAGIPLGTGVAKQLFGDRLAAASDVVFRRRLHQFTELAGRCAHDC